MSKVIKIKKGLDIHLKGQAEKLLVNLGVSANYAVKPTDFEGLTPKILVKSGFEVKVGTPLFYDKYRPEILFTSPVSGTVLEVNRGERRRVMEIIIKADEKIEYKSFKKANPNDLQKEEIKENVLKSGLWPTVRQRPYAVIANPADTPKAIYISGFDSAPLAPDYEFILKEQLADFQTGVDALKKLVDGPVNLSTHNVLNNNLFKSVNGVEFYEFEGPHPASSIGVQINKIQALNKGDIVWYLNPADVAKIGKLFNEGIYDSSKIIALTGSEIKMPQYFKVISGADILSIVRDNVQKGEVRFISGNVLTGEKVNKTNFLGYYDYQVTVIPEGNKPEFLGWGTPGFGKFSMTRTFFSWLTPKKQMSLDTNLHGGLRPFVVTGEFEKVFPMDIYPMQLLKAIIIEDIDLMEQLGIYEVAEEDFALCEVINTSKIEVQKLVRKGINTMIKEFS
ncbi:MAG: NADH:ubiquinone reductase (Na(+)-transporting) subunit A [Bacteroidetes bacterium 4572_117]|nr:MAG: NADH:ubiquinone reductase (Na(+)-transporting) subunit A [Bacteroidetes bacterium 4572_117]